VLPLLGLDYLLSIANLTTFKITLLYLLISCDLCLGSDDFDWEKKMLLAPVLQNLGNFLILGADWQLEEYRPLSPQRWKYSPYSTRGEGTLESSGAGLDKDYCLRRVKWKALENFNPI